MPLPILPNIHPYILDIIPNSQSYDHPHIQQLLQSVKQQKWSKLSQTKSLQSIYNYLPQSTPSNVSKSFILRSESLKIPQNYFSPKIKANHWCQLEDKKNASDEDISDIDNQIKVFSIPVPKLNQKDSTCSFESRESGNLERIKLKRRLTLNVKRSMEEERKMSIEIETRELDPDSKTPFPKGVNFEEKKSVHDAYEAPSRQSQIREILLDVKEQQWKQDSKKTIQEVNEQDQSPCRRQKNLMSQTKATQTAFETILLKKELKQRQLQVQSLKRQNQNLQSMVAKLSQQTLSLNSLLDSQKNYKSQIEQLKRKLLESQQQILNIKQNQVYMMQEFYEASNEEALQHAIKYLSV